MARICHTRSDFMDFFFADDSRQRQPSRPGMGPLVAAGGILVPGEKVRILEDALEALCTDYSFPLKEEFKWSPGRELWMRENLTGERRTKFLRDAVALAARLGTCAIVVIEDETSSPAIRGNSPERDSIVLLLERIDNELAKRGTYGLVIADRPPGNRKTEDQFLVDCLEDLQAETNFVRNNRILLNVLSTPSKLVRCLQLADVVTACALARVSGESNFSPPVFADIASLLPRHFSRSGGCGLKIHPDFKYANLYHWLLGDTHYVRLNTGTPLPLAGRPYRLGEYTP